MKIGVYVFVTDYSMPIVGLAQALEERGQPGLGRAVHVVALPSAIARH